MLGNCLYTKMLCHLLVCFYISLTAYSENNLFESTIAPILETKCIGCHNTEKAKGKVSVSSFEEMFNGKKKLIVKGDPHKSLLFKVIIPEDGEKAEMPEDGDSLSKSETESIKKWIESGAHWPAGRVLKERSKADKSWWAYQKLNHKKPEVKSYPPGWNKNPIDAFILEQLEKKDLKNSSKADRRTLIRRAYYDLTGLPPSVEEVEAFVNNKSASAYEDLIDSLLASPRYGEKWGRHWLDIVRFGESNGYERNFIINDLWPFRDYVIRSINDDKPISQLIKEHLAGDVIADGNPQVEIGSAFLVAGPYDDVGNQDPAAAAIIRANTMDEIIRTTSEAFLGMTVGCAKCHDHKFDPIKTADYYSLYSTFSGVRHGRRVWASKEEKERFHNESEPLKKEIGQLEAQLKKLTAPDQQKEKEAVHKKLEELKSKLSKVKPLPEAWIGHRSAGDAKGPFHVFKGGDPQKKGEAVTSASISTLSEVHKGYSLPENSSESERRLKLAEWITSDENPLALRVLANRVWQYHFGTGIVNTPSDFGYMGGKPSHPGLLDFLAEKLKENNWRLKSIHKLIMTSQAYMQSSEWREKEAKLDGDARLLWRFPPRRLNSEEIRDSMLSIAGKLNTSMGGPGFRLYKVIQDNVSTYYPLDKHGPETYRRSVYHQNARASTVDLLSDFDQADCTLSVGKRSITTSPLQALTLMNHSFTIYMAGFLAQRAQTGEKDTEKRITRAFQLAYQRQPSSEELKRSAEFVKENGLKALCRALLNSNEFIFVD